MTLAVAAVCLFVLALPGIAARRAYLSGVFSRAYLRLTLTDEIAVSLVFAVPFHIIGCAVAHCLHHPVDPVLVGRLLTGEFGTDGAELSDSFLRLLHDWHRIIMYGVLVNLAAVCTGHGWRWIVRRRRWDRRFEYSRYLVIPASKILNINVTYLELKPETDSGGASTLATVDASPGGA